MRDLTVGNEGRLIWKFALPMLIGNVFQQLYQVVDSIIVGNVLGKSALAAIGSTTPIIFSLVALIIGISSGFGIIISQYFGSQQINNVKKTISTMIISLGILSLIMSALGIFLNVYILNLLKLPQDLIPQASIYMNIFFVGIIVMFGYNAISSILRGLGDSKTPLYFLIISTIANILLDLLFVMVFDWGVAGAAWATVVSTSGAFLSAALYLNRTHSVINLKSLNLIFDKKIFSEGVRIGLPSGLQQTVVGFGMMALLGIVNQFGTDVIAAYTVGSRIDSFISLPAMALSAALANFTGQNLGAGKISRIKNGLKATMLIAFVFCLVLVTIIIVFKHQLVSMFNNDTEVIRIGAEYLTIVNLFYILFIVMFIFSGVLRGAGATIVPMFITVLSLWLIRIPVAAVLSKYMGEKGIWWAIPIAWFVGMLGSLLYYFSGKWKTKGVVYK